MMISVETTANKQKIPHEIHTIQDIVSTYNQQLADAFYISTTRDLPSKKNIAHCYRSGADFSLKTREEVMLWTYNSIVEHHQKSDFFVYNERTQELLPFQTHDCLMHDAGYFTYNGKEYVSYDDNGNEIQRFMVDKHQHKKKDK